MRNIACQEWLRCSHLSDFIFLTGDLGFMALESLRDSMKERFVNAGVAEQNMLSVAAGLALEGLNVWAYSIAPFCYARPYEQIRNDICHHNLPVKLVGNGGGYSYGPMGKSHHAIEDYGTLLNLPNMRVYVPAFGEDLKTIIPMLNSIDHPAYLRLGRCEQPQEMDTSEYAPWRKILEGEGIPIVVVGPLAGSYWNVMQRLDRSIRPELWVLSEIFDMSFDFIPGELVNQIEQRGLCVAEEHMTHGSAGQKLAGVLLSKGLKPRRYIQFTASGYPSNLYGSQSFHRRESGLESDQILRQLNILH